MSKVFVLDTKKQPLDPVHPGHARILLDCGKVAVFKRYPFTIILKGAIKNPEVHPLRIKIDPGSQTTGIALVDDGSGRVVWAAELAHRGQMIKKALDQRRAVRRGRRQRTTRYRTPRFQNRRRRSRWIPPSLESRVANVLTWVNRLARLCTLGAMSLELVKFDLQQMDNPEISGMEYQQGTLFGYEVREYLLEKCDRACSYCGIKGVPRSRPKGAKKVKGFQTGDIVRATVTTGTKQGIYVGRVLVRASGSFDIRTKHGRVQGISHRFCTPVHRSDGYNYKLGVRYGQESPSQAAS
jgi:hypothetical protein